MRAWRGNARKDKDPLCPPTDESPLCPPTDKAQLCPSTIFSPPQETPGGHPLLGVSLRRDEKVPEFKSSRVAESRVAWFQGRSGPRMGADRARLATAASGTPSAKTIIRRFRAGARIPTSRGSSWSGRTHPPARPGKNHRREDRSRRAGARRSRPAGARRFSLFKKRGTGTFLQKGKRAGGCRLSSGAWRRRRATPGGRKGSRVTGLQGCKVEELKG